VLIASKINRLLLKQTLCQEKYNHSPINLSQEYHQASPRNITRFLLEYYQAKVKGGNEFGIVAGLVACPQ